MKSVEFKFWSVAFTMFLMPLEKVKNVFLLLSAMDKIVSQIGLFRHSGYSCCINMSLQDSVSKIQSWNACSKALFIRISPVSWGCRICQLYLCRGKIIPKHVLGMTLNFDYSQVHWPEVVIPIRVLIFNLKLLFVANSSSKILFSVFLQRMTTGRETMGICIHNK